MKILEINTEKTWRGGERQTYYNIKGFMEQGEEVTLIALKGYPLAKRVSELGVEVIEIESNLSAYRYLCSYGRKYDVIHAQTAKAQSLAIFSKPFHKKPVVYTRRVDFIPKGFISKFKYHKTDQVVAITNAIKNILEEHLGLDRIRVITEIVEEKDLNLERASKLRQKYKGRKILATTSALVPHKDPFTMIKAIKELSYLRNDFVFLHFGTGPLMGAAKNLVSELEIENLYKFMGFVENVEDFFAVFDVFVMSSSEEGLGSSILDAFVYRVPVVSTDAGGLKETVEGCGLLCRTGDYKCLAENINRILEDNKLRNKLIEKAYYRAKTKHSIERVTHDYIELLSSILKF